MRPQQCRSLFLEQLLDDLSIGQPLIDSLGQLPAHGLGHAAAVRIAVGQGVELAGAAVSAYAAQNNYTIQIESIDDAGTTTFLSTDARGRDVGTLVPRYYVGP